MCHCKREGIKHKYPIAQTVIKSGIIIFIYINSGSQSKLELMKNGIKTMPNGDKNLFKINFFETA